MPADDKAGEGDGESGAKGETGHDLIVKQQGVSMTDVGYGYGVLQRRPAVVLYMSWV